MENQIVETINDPHAELKKRIIYHMENGRTFEKACILSGTSRITGHRLKTLSGKEKQRLSDLKMKEYLTDNEKKELKELHEREYLCETFETQVEAAIIVYQTKLVDIMNYASLKDWRAAHELLKQRFPEEWVITNKVQHEGDITINGAKELAEAIQKLIHEPNTEENQGDTVTSSE